jgi:DNA helicase II / ATP-dependent DNA helicase PcrA
MSFFSHLNSPQKQAVETTEGRVLILAGAGSGKTSVLIARTAHLILNKKIPPRAILGLTFTNKAAGEMRSRIKQMISSELSEELTLCTFHSFCMQLLRREIHALGYTNHFSLYDERDVQRLTRQLAHNLLEHEGELPSLKGTMECISYLKSRGLSYEAGSVKNPAWKGDFTKELYERLQTCMRAYNAVDFDSLLSLTVELFERFPQVLETYQERFRYIMIDEYQDTSPVQYRLAHLLSLKHNNLCVVGDDDQSIYGWRGAEIKNILQFEASSTIKLEQNYRSTSMILHAANAVIEQNKERHPKALWSSKQSSEPIVMFHAPTEGDEAQSVALRLVSLHKKKKIPWGEMAILYRSNQLSRGFELALMETVWEKEGKWVRGIPFQVFGGTEFAERSETKDLLAYLKAILNPLDQESLLRIINVPRRGISDQALDLLTQAARGQNRPLWHLLQEVASSWCFDELSDKARSGVTSFVHLMEEAKERFETPPLHKTVQWLLEEIDYKKAIEEEVKSDKMRAFKWENVGYFVEAIARYEEEKKAPLLDDFLAETLLDEKHFSSYEKRGKEDAVNLMTFHSAKGLEFSACFLTCLEDHLIPHEKSVGPEEERRLFYVGITRAKEHLTLSMARSRKRMGKETGSAPSRFLFEIPKELLKIASWQTID